MTIVYSLSSHTALSYNVNSKLLYESEAATLDLTRCKGPGQRVITPGQLGVPLWVPSKEPLWVPLKEPLWVPVKEPFRVPSKKPFRVPSKEPLWVPLKEPFRVSFKGTL